MFVARTHLLGIFRPGFAQPCGLESCSCISKSLEASVKGGIQACEERREEQWDGMRGESADG